MDLNDIKQKGAALGPWAHMATVRPDGRPDVTPVHPCWEGDTLWIMAGTRSVKARNIGTNAEVALHWQVTAVGDGLELWGTAVLHSDLDAKRRLWNGVFDYDLNLFSSGGPDGSPDVGFIAITPTRALWLGAYGMSGTERWSA